MEDLATIHRTLVGSDEIAGLNDFNKFVMLESSVGISLDQEIPCPKYHGCWFIDKASCWGWLWQYH
jgi:hypothetical protein